MKVRIIDTGNKKEIEQIRLRKSKDDVELVVKEILEKVRSEGDEALRVYAKRFDGIDLKNIEVPKSEIKKAYLKLDISEISAIKRAAKNIIRFARFQIPKEKAIEISKGIQCGFRISPIEKIGCYIPGGKYPLPSTVLMTVIPAKVAGVKKVFIASPKLDPSILVAADICGADKIYAIGGAQAIAAMAYGTESVLKVDKIVGPGNIYVTEAKKQVFGDVGIDMLAGPSEILIISDKGNPRFIAADMLAQAEHDEMASAILITASMELALKVKAELNKQVKKLETKETIKKSFERYSCIILAKNTDEAARLSNEFAPEHLVIESKKMLKRITNAGSIFIGRYSCEAAGDYCSGPNHVLPTNGTSRFRAGLCVYDFLKIQTYQELTKDGLDSLKPTISVLADMEKLSAHKNSVLKRFEKTKGDDK